MDSLSALDATFSFNFKEGALKPLVRDAHIKARLSCKPSAVSIQRHQENQLTLSKIFALEIWRRRQHEHLIRQLEHITKTLDAKLSNVLKVSNEAQDAEEREAKCQLLEKDLLSTRTLLNNVEQRYSSLTRSNQELKTRTEHLVNSLVAATNENKLIREREAELKQKLEEAESRVSQLLTIKSERVIHSSRYLPVRTAEICPSALTCRPLKKREVLESTVKGLRSRRFPSKKFHDPASAQHDVAPNPTDHATESVPAATDNTAPASGLHSRFVAAAKRTQYMGIHSTTPAERPIQKASPDLASQVFNVGTGAPSPIREIDLETKLKKQFTHDLKSTHTVDKSSVRQRASRVRRIDAVQQAPKILDTRTPLRERLRPRPKKP